MADDLDRAIKQIAQMFGMPNNSSSAPAPQSQESVPPLEPVPSVPALSPQGGNMMDNLGILAKARDMIDTFNNVSDHRINLIRSIQPFLGATRQQRCESCVQILKIVAVLNSLSPNRTNLR